MKKVQMSRTNKILTSKNSPNLNSHLSPLTSHGITLMSLIVYMTIMFVVLALIMRFTTNFTKNIRDVADTTFEEEFEKLNMYMLQETNKSENYVEEVSEEQKSITFTDGNTIAFQKENESETGEIYFNSIKLCEGVDNCTFTSPDDEITNKTTITVTLTINGTTKSIQYVINDKLSIAQSTITEEVYIVEKTEEQRLPIDYQEIEYIESTGTQYINTRFYPDANTNAKYKICVNEYKTWGPHLLSSKNFFFPFFRNNDNALIAIRGTDTKLIINNITFSNNQTYEYESFWNNDVLLNGTKVGELASDKERDTTPLYIGAYGGEPNSSTYSLVGKIYYCQIYNENIINRDFIPCYRISDGEIGLYDTVNDEFYTNSGSGTFIKGPEVY